MARKYNSHCLRLSLYPQVDNYEACFVFGNYPELAGCLEIGIVTQKLRSSSTKSSTDTIAG